MKGKKFKFKWIFAFFLGAILVLLVSIYIYNKPHVDVKSSEAAYVLTAQNLIDEYRQNEIGTNEKYSENVIQVKGRIFDITTVKGNGVVTLKDGDWESSIICHMSPDENIRTLKLKKGQEINIKGICTGYLLDVIMVRCTLVD